MSTLPSPARNPNPLIQAFCQLLYATQITEYQFQQDADLIRTFREATPDLWLQLQANGILINIKPSPQSNLFRDTAASLHRPIDELLPPDAAHALHAAMERTLREEKPATFEWTLTDGADEKHFEVRVVYLNSQQVLVIMHDIAVQWQALEELRDLPRRMWNAQEEERRRLSSDLHDEIGQDLTAILLGVNHVKESLTGEVRARLDETAAALQALTRKVRRLAQDLRPATLDQLGLAAALNSLLMHYAQQTAPHFEWQLPDSLPRFSPDIELAAYRIVQEALTNVVRHAQAQHVWVNVQQGGNRLFMQIMDDGQGFDAGATSPADRFGLLGMSERAIMLGGKIHIRSAPGQGTQISVELPMDEPLERKAPP